ncbi:hypothetical protein CC2G_014419 [Coprinopsis cinerea AmutBmut pab1-1]|nr:hypothetical protein CC2G_014419 [Coprinopsis cinerea AmutBmut pab1-1]
MRPGSPILSPDPFPQGQSPGSPIFSSDPVPQGSPIFPSDPLPQGQSPGSPIFSPDPAPRLGYQQMMGRAPIICVARLVQSRGRCLHSEVWSGLVR